MAAPSPAVGYTIGGVKIQFPCKAYPSQLAMMNSVSSTHYQDPSGDMQLHLIRHTHAFIHVVNEVDYKMCYVKSLGNYEVLTCTFTLM